MSSNDPSASPTPPTAPRAIVAGHGDFAAGLVSAVEQITGRGAQLIPVSVQRLSVEDIEELLRTRMQAVERARDLHRSAGRQLHDGVASDSARHGRRRARRRRQSADAARFRVRRRRDCHPRRRATRRSAARAAITRARRPARDARAVPHRRSADPRSGRRRMGTAAGYRRSSCSSTTPSRRATGSRSSIAWAFRPRWTSTSTRPTTRSPRSRRIGTIRGAAFCSPATSRRCAQLVDGAGVTRRERRRHSFARRPNAASALRLLVARRRAGAARARRARRRS